MRKETRIGIITVLFYQIISRFFNFPGFVSGIIHGLGMSLIIVGILPDKAYEKLKGWKRSIFKS